MLEYIAWANELEVPTLKSRSLTADDFFTGLFAALALKGRVTISIRGNSVDSALATVFQDLEARADQERLDIRFRIRPHPLHGDSATVRDSITHAAQRGLISLDNPDFQDIRLKLAGPEAESLFEHLPGSKKLYADLADKLLEAVG